MRQSSVKSWLKKEFKGVSFNDKRLEKRFHKIAIGFAEKSEKNISSSFEDWADIKACYRFFENDKLTPSKILEPHRKRTLNCIREQRRVLFIQDTVVFSYGQRKETEGLDFCGKLNNFSPKGLLSHGLLAVSDSGLPLGLVHQEFISRKSIRKGSKSEKQKECRKLPASEKESWRWIDFIKKSEEFDCGDTEVIHVADREGDLYDLYKECTEKGEKFLIRARTNRSVNKDKKNHRPKDKLFDILESEKPQAKMKVKVQSNKKGEKYREAELSIVYKEISVFPPFNRNLKDYKEAPQPIKMMALMATEKHSPKSEVPIKWFLLTNVATHSAKEAKERIRWYSLRWNIELFHKIMKSGFSMEKAQLRSAEKLKKYIALKSIQAWRIFWMTRFFNENKEENCETVLTKHEWKVLYKKFQKGKALPQKPPDIKTVFFWIGKLGGFIGRKSDGHPGVISMWRAWMRFMDLLEAYEIFCSQRSQ